jgi:hypothetical protein
MEDHTKIEPTAALVMIWAREMYGTGSPGRFYSLLDLSAGEKMKAECDTACPWYNQVTLNRKWMIHRLAGNFIRDADGPCQVILPAAGKSPLALELLDDHNDRIRSVIEIDIRGMEEKKRLYEKAAPEFAGKICCVTADLFDLPGVLEAVKETGMYDPSLPTVIIPEGISYYIPPSLLSGVIGLFSSPDHRNTVIFDFMLPCRLVNEDRRKFPKGIWRVINDDCNPDGTVTYTPEEIEETLRSAGCTRIDLHSMHFIEKDRTGGNEFFMTVEDGWTVIAEGFL